MRFIPETEAGALRAHLDKELEGPVSLDLFIEPKSAIVVPGRPECELCEETRDLLEDVASLSDQITLTVHDVRTESDLARDTGVSRVPTLVLRGAARGVMRYLGIPAGLEFGTLLEDLAAVSRGTTTLKQESRTKLASLTQAGSRPGVRDTDVSRTARRSPAWPIRRRWRVAMSRRTLSRSANFRISPLSITCAACRKS